MVLHYSGSSYNCDSVKDKITDLITKVKNEAMNPMEALIKVREYMKDAFDKFKNLGPVAAALTAMSGLGGKASGVASSVKNSISDLFSPIATTTATTTPTTNTAKSKPVVLSSNTTFGELKNKIKQNTSKVAQEYVLKILERYGYDDKKEIGNLLDDNNLLKEYITVYPTS